MSTEQTQTTATTDIALLPPAERAVIVLGSNKAEEHIKEIMQESAEITVVTDKTGRELAHKSGMKLKNARTAIEKTGKAARDDANNFSKAVIAEEKRLKDIMAAEEERVFALRDEFDRKEAAEKEERERKERERVDGIRAKIEAFKRLPIDCANDNSDELQATIDDLSGVVITHEDFAEFAEEANQVVVDVIVQLRGMQDTIKQREAAEAAVAAERERLSAEREEIERERAQIAAERAELETLRAAKAVAEQAALKPVEEPQLVMATKTITEDKARDLFPDPAVVAENVAAQAVATSDLLMGKGVVAQPEHKAEQEAMNHEAAANLEAVATIGVDHAAGDDTTVVYANGGSADADTLVSELAGYTSMQFIALAKKVEAVGAAEYGAELRAVATRLASGEFNAAIMAANWSDMGNADKEMALSSHACVSLIFGDEEMGGSVLREAAE